MQPSDHPPAAAAVASPGVASQAGRFALVGLLNTATTLMIIAALRQGLGAPVWLASGIGYAVGTVQSYWLNRSWTFAGGANAPMAGQFLRFVLVNILLGLAFSGLNELLARRFALMVATLLTLMVMVPISFVAMRLFVFGRRRA
jgi:putative flippase GtrA